jgi:hypothetical protein
MKSRSRYEKLLEDPGIPPETRLMVELLLDIRDLLKDIAENLQPQKTSEGNNH